MYYGPEFVSRAILKWAAQNGMDMALSDPGKPRQNGADESFNGKFRDECLGLEWFRTRVGAKVVIEQWRRHYNAIRPHSSLAYLALNEFKRSSSGVVQLKQPRPFFKTEMGRRNQAGQGSVALCEVSSGYVR
ncbi:hypothetical protein YK56LOC_32880 [Caballeronia sp. HLA56]